MAAIMAPTNKQNEGTNFFITIKMTTARDTIKANNNLKSPINLISLFHNYYLTLLGICLAPVSYTHLDVYKRQTLDRNIALATLFCV